MKEPRKGDGWEPENWGEALETNENGNLDAQSYGFDSVHEMMMFLEGEGLYEDRNSFEPGEEDLETKKTEMKNTEWQIPSKLEEIEEYLEQDIDKAEIDLDPYGEAAWHVQESEPQMRDAETKYTAHFVAYDPDGEDDRSNFYISTSWYDTPPEEMNVEDIFNPR